MKTLYLIEAKARNNYACERCSIPIPKGSTYFRHDPIAQARIHRGEQCRQWCKGCIGAAKGGTYDKLTHRHWIPEICVKNSSRDDEIREGLFALAQVQLYTLPDLLLAELIGDPDRVHDLSPARFQEFVCDRLYAMGMEPKQVGNINQRDGGIDIVFWPRSGFRFLGAAQVKHHRNRSVREGSPTVRDFTGAIGNLDFSVGILVTNTGFTPDAQWFAKERAKLVRLRDYHDIRRWIVGNFNDPSEWREIPEEIELCPGVVVKTN